MNLRASGFEADTAPMWFLSAEKVEGLVLVPSTINAPVPVCLWNTWTSASQP